MITFIALAAPFVLYAICYWLQALRERNTTDPIVARENHVGQKRTVKVASGTTQRNRRKRKRKKK